MKEKRGQVDIYEEIKKHWKENGDTLKFKEKETASYDVIRGQSVKYAYGRLKSWQDAEDAVQDAYLHALSYPPKEWIDNFGGLFKLYLDQAIYHVRRGKNNRSRIEEEEVIDDKENSQIDIYPSPDLIPDQVTDIVDQTNLIMDMSDSLKPKQKAIVRLSLIFGYSYREVSGITKSSPKIIDNVLRRFRDKVKKNPKYEDLRW